jgi:hypothetical protein
LIYADLEIAFFIFVIMCKLLAVLNNNPLTLQLPKKLSLQQTAFDAS